MKPISYKQETEDTERICTWEGPTGSCSVSVRNIYLVFLSISGTKLLKHLEFLKKC